MTYRISNRQFNSLKLIAASPQTLQEIMTLDQRSGGSLAMRELIDFHRGTKLFRATPAGKLCLRAFEETDISRKNKAAPLSVHIKGEMSNGNRYNRVAQNGNRAPRARVAASSGNGAHSRTATASA